MIMHCKWTLWEVSVLSLHSFRGTEENGYSFIQDSASDCRHLFVEPHFKQQSAVRGSEGKQVFHLLKVKENCLCAQNEDVCIA
jgi:hypothetical protein